MSSKKNVIITERIRKAEYIFSRSSSRQLSARAPFVFLTCLIDWKIEFRTLSEIFSAYFHSVSNSTCAVTAYFCTLFEIFIFCLKNQPRKLSIFFWLKDSWKCCGFGFFSCWQLWCHEKNCQTNDWVKNSWKCWGFVKIEFLDKNLTFRIVWKCELNFFDG